MKLLPLILLIQVCCLLQVSGIAAVDANATNYIVHHDPKSGASPSPWLKGVADQEWRRRRMGCRSRPWICNPRGERPRRKKCCQNRCINVYSDVNHCGSCRHRCRFGRKCCAKRCVDVRFSRRNCGRCFNRCPLRSRCYMGMCGYDDDGYMFTMPQLDQLPPQLDETGSREPDIAVEDLKDDQELPATSG